MAKITYDLTFKRKRIKRLSDLFTENPNIEQTMISNNEIQIKFKDAAKETATTKDKLKEDIKQILKQNKSGDLE